MSILVSKFLGRTLLVHLLAFKAWTLSVISVTSCFYFSLAHFDYTTTCFHNSLKQTRFPFLAQTGLWNWGFCRGETLDSGTLKCPILDPILELILDPSWPPLGARLGLLLGLRKARKHCKNQWFLTLFKISVSKRLQNPCILQGLQARGCNIKGRGAQNYVQRFKTLAFYKVF